MRMLLRWVIGISVGTLLIGITSPLFVRSYVPRQVNRGQVTLMADVDHRWRSEGYATTAIGPLGMPGKTDLSPRRNGQRRVALWGDSQAEGVCVDDRDKIFAVTQTLMSVDRASIVDVYPFAQSGEDLADWLPQMRWAEHEVDVDAHVILVTELTDFRLANLNASPMAINQTQNWMADHLPAFVIQSARHLMTAANDETPRKLRFGLGPVYQEQTVAPEPLPLDAADLPDAGDPSSTKTWTRAVTAIKDQTEKPVVLLYAPILPRIVNGKIIWDDADDGDFQVLSSVAATAGLTVVDVRADFRQSAIDGRWTHGYHNGQFGEGHLNETGNAIVAGRLSETLVELFDAPTAGN